ncbi:MAG TPA: SMC family ATPase, partial [Actinomycetota bacterium]|nr:SMC family ATPase [Actinomycetota bacterium]
MRPLNLSIKGFTAFRDEQQIDFTDLDLFSLWGPTGSGKSSVLDAITFALYGKVERVEGTKEEKLTALITHGQPRMAVTLDFRAGDNSYRITRTNSLNGSKVRLERREGEDFVSYGEGADSVTEVSKIVPSLIGLDYNAFTRSVVLPQGKFAEFLAGDAKKRRDILTELLGLEMFGRMAQRSNEIARDAKSGLQAKEALLASEYAGIDEAAAERASLLSKELGAEVKTITEAESLLEELVEESDDQTRKAKTLIELGREVNDLRETFEEHAAALEGHGRELAKASETGREVREELKARDKEHARLAKERGRLEKEHGTLEDLADLRAQVLSLQNLENEAKKASKVVADQSRIEAAVKKALKEHDAAVKKTEAAHEIAQAELGKRENEHDLAYRHDLVGALTHDLKKGDACPVCERPLLSVPKSDADLKAAKESMAKAASEVK